MLPSDYLKKGWCQSVPARDSKGYACGVDDPDACSYCMRGALSASAGTEGITRQQAADIFLQLNILVGYECRLRDFIYWNDAVCTSQSSAVAMMEAAEARVLLVSNQ